MNPYDLRKLADAVTAYNLVDGYNGPGVKSALYDAADKIEQLSGLSTLVKANKVLDEIVEMARVLDAMPEDYT